MLVLFETPAGYSLFKWSDDKKLKKTDPSDVADKFFCDPTKAHKYLDLHAFEPFKDTADALAAASNMVEGKVSSGLAKFLKKKLKNESSHALAVADKGMAHALKEKLGNDNLEVLHSEHTQEVFRGIRLYMNELLESGGVSPEDLRSMQLGLSHSLSRYKLKFSADKVDTMVIQAVGLLDELDKEINTYAMRTKEWYGWHFPELQNIVSDNAQYARLVLKVGMRTNIKDCDLSDVLQEDEDVEAAVKEAAEISMGTEIADFDIINIQSLADQVISMTEYRSQLFEYLKNRMNAIAPNLTILVGELVGARLISHAGSLMNLAKQPASTVQILGAEKALFRALKTKHDTPKYGLIYHASLIGQAAPKNKGKISRVLAAKAALAIRVDALSDEQQDLDTTIGFEGRSKVEARLRVLEGGTFIANTGGNGAKTARYDAVAASSASGPSYNDASDMQLDTTTNGDDSPKKKKKKDKKKESKKRKADDSSGEDNNAAAEDDKAALKAAKKAKKEKKKRKSEG